MKVQSRWCGAASGAWVALAAGPALAAPPDGLAAPAAPAAPPAQGEAQADPRVEAVARFEKGLRLFDAGDWDAALAEFLEARRLYPLRNATYNAAVCLEKLRRYDEAVAMLEDLLRDFGEAMPADAKERAQRKLVELRALVGTIEVEGAEPGAEILVDGQIRGEHPLLGPLRVSAGSHLIRVMKPGFEPFEARVEVAGGRSARVTARLPALTRSGRLRVVEQRGEALEVVVDGVVVGQTPWEGRLPVGEHVVLLRGRGDVGTPPVPVRVDVDRTTPITLAAEELTARLRVSPVPVNASVAIDAVSVGRGVWVGRLRAGTHRVEVTAPGFLPVSREVRIPRGEGRTVVVALRRDPSSPFAERPAHWTVEMASAPLLAPGFGGDVGQGIGVGGYGALRVGYELPIRLAFGLSLGGLRMTQTTEGRRAPVQPVDLREVPQADGAGAVAVTVDDSLTLGGLLAGPWIGLSLGEQVITQFRFGGGALLGSASDARGGPPSPVGASSLIDTSVEAYTAFAVYLAPEVRVGWALSPRLTVSAGLELLALLSPSPARWGQGGPHQMAITDALGHAAYGTFAAQRFVSPAQLAFAPGLGVRYEL